MKITLSYNKIQELYFDHPEDDAVVELGQRMRDGQFEYEGSAHYSFDDIPGLLSLIEFIDKVGGNNAICTSKN